MNAREALVMSKLKVASHQQVHKSTRLSTSRVHARAAAAQNLTTTMTTLLVERSWRNNHVQYSIQAFGPMPIPVSRQSAHRLLSHKHSSSRLLLSARPTITFSAAQHHHRTILLCDKHTRMRTTGPVLLRDCGVKPVTPCSLVRHRDLNMTTSRQSLRSEKWTLLLRTS